MLFGDAKKMLDEVLGSAQSLTGIIRSQEKSTVVLKMTNGCPGPRKLSRRQINDRPPWLAAYPKAFPQTLTHAVRLFGRVDG